MKNQNTRRGFTQYNKVILNLIQGLQRFLGALRNDIRGRCQIKFGMTSLCNNGAFTLIELLVVVLIIGILATVAVPQYQKAVLKSRFHTLYPVTQGLAQAQEIFYLGNGEYADDLAKLDVAAVGNATGQTVTLPKDIQVKLGVEDNHIYVRAEKDDNALMIYQNQSPNFAGETHCEAKLDNTLANWLCEKGLDGMFVGNKFGYSIYSLSPETVGSLGRIYYDATNTTITDGDSCVATKTWGCSIAVDGGKCVADANWGCFNISVKNGECIANADGGCHAGSYNNSTCISEVSGGCWGAASHTNHSACIGSNSQTCGGGKTFLDHSYCESNSTGSCYNNNFKDHSYCAANVSGACRTNKYDSTSFCTSENDYCPTGTPKGTWNDTTQTYELDGWNGNCCNPAYMTSDTCPSNAPVCS